MHAANQRGVIGLHMRQQVDPKKLELSIARTAFGVSPLRLLDARGLDNGMAALEASLHHAVRELHKLEDVAKVVPSKSTLHDRRGLVLREIRELEFELRSYQLEKVRRRELGMATVGIRLQNERWRMIHGRREPQLLNAEGVTEAGATKERPSFIQTKLPVLSPSRVTRCSRKGVDEAAK